MSNFYNEKFDSLEKTNYFKTHEEYQDLVSSNRIFYPIYRRESKSNDIDTLAFLGKRVDEKEYDCSNRVIPYGDIILQSHTFGFFDYYRTHTGFFAKRHLSSRIFPISEKLFILTREYRVNFLQFMSSPQAGLTRGSKRSFSDREETQKNQLLSIQSKYKDGVK